MSDKCKNPSCDKELIHTEGRRKKEFCSKECRNKVNTALFQERHKADKKPKMKCIPIEEFKKLSNVVEVKGAGDLEGLTFFIQKHEAFEGKPLDWSKVEMWIPTHTDDRTNKFTNAARGRDESGVNKDEINSTLKSTNEEKGRISKGSFDDKNGMAMPPKKGTVIPPPPHVNFNAGDDYPVKMAGEKGVDFQLRLAHWKDNKK